MNPECEARIRGRCDANTEVRKHHRHKREHGGYKFFGGSLKCLKVCTRCHDFIHANEAWAESWGLLMPPGLDPKRQDPISRAVPNRTGPISYNEELRQAGKERVAKWMGPKWVRQQEVVESVKKLPIDSWIANQMWGNST